MQRRAGGPHVAVLCAHLPRHFVAIVLVAMSLDHFVPSASAERAMTSVQILSAMVRIGAEDAANGSPPPDVPPSGCDATPTGRFAVGAVREMAHPSPPCGSDGYALSKGIRIRGRGYSSDYAWRTPAKSRLPEAATHTSTAPSSTDMSSMERSASDVQWRGPEHNAKQGETRTNGEPATCSSMTLALSASVALSGSDGLWPQVFAGIPRHDPNRSAHTRAAHVQALAWANPSGYARQSQRLRRSPTVRLAM